MTPMTTATAELLEAAKQENSDIRFYTGKVLPIAREEFTKAAIAQVPALLARIAALEEALYGLNPNNDDAEWLDSEELGSFQAGHLRRAALALKENDDGR